MLGIRIGSRAARQSVGTAAVVVPLIACVAVLAWRGVADPVDGVALGALGVGLLVLARVWPR